MSGFSKLTASMRTVSGEDVIRGSSDIPLSPAGRTQAKQLGTNLADRGGMDEIHTSTLKRASDTAAAIGEACGVDPQDCPELHPWHLGGIEGQPTKKVLDEMAALIVKTPNKTPAGRGRLSTADGESFNEFKNRFLETMKGFVDDFQGDEKIALVTHFRNIKALQAWLRAGMKDDLSIDPQEMLRKDGEPGDVERFAPVGARWRLLHDSGKGDLKPGIYIIRHGLTDWNGEAHGKTGTAHSGYYKVQDGE